MWKSRKKWEESLKGKEYDLEVTRRKVEIDNMLSSHLESIRQQISQYKDSQSDTKRALNQEMFELRLKRDAVRLELDTLEELKKLRKDISSLEVRKEEMTRELLQTQVECSFLRGVVTEFAKNHK